MTWTGIGIYLAVIIIAVLTVSLFLPANINRHGNTTSLSEALKDSSVIKEIYDRLDRLEGKK